MSRDSRLPVCLILGCGRGIGSGVAAKFCANGFHVIGVRRKDRSAKDGSSNSTKATAKASDERKSSTATSPAADEASAVTSWRYFDVLSESELQKQVEDIEKNIGPIHAVIYNLGANIGETNRMQMLGANIGETNRMTRLQQDDSNIFACAHLGSRI